MGPSLASVGLILEDALGNFRDQLFSNYTKNIQIPKPYILPTECIYVFPIIPHKNMSLLPSNYNPEVFAIEAVCVYCAVRTESVRYNSG
jgi:hypothetical protein